MDTTGRRLKRWWLRQRSTIALLNLGVVTPDAVVMPKAVVPDGAVIRSIYADPGRQAIAVIVEHESFEEVKEGNDIPNAEDPLDFETTVCLLVPPGVTLCDECQRKSEEARETQ